MSDNQKTIGNIPNAEFAKTVNSAIDKGRRRAKTKVETVLADDEYVPGSTPEPDRPGFEVPSQADLWAEMRRIWEKYQFAEYNRKKRQDERKQIVDFIKRVGAVFLAVFISMAIWELIL